MEPTKYRNLYRTNRVYKYVYKEDNFEIGARDCNDLKFKLAMRGIKLQEQTEPIVENIVKEEVSFNIKHFNPVRSTCSSNRSVSKKEPPKRNKNYIKSKKDVKSGKIKHDDLKGRVSKDRRSNNTKRTRSLNKSVSKKEPLKRNKDYVDSEDDVNFGKIRYRDLKGGVFETWGPDNSKRARKLRQELIR